jgi:hypothetical protein
MAGFSFILFNDKTRRLTIPASWLYHSKKTFHIKMIQIWIIFYRLGGRPVCSNLGNLITWPETGLSEMIQI